MRIVGVEIVPVKIPFEIKFDIASGPYSRTADYVVVRVFTDENIIGIGEASPMPAFSFEDQGSVVNALRDISNAIIGEDPFRLERVVSRLESIAPGSPFARAAVDIALFDILGKKLNVPVYTLLGGLYRDEVSLAWPIGLKSPEEAAEEARIRVMKGFKAIKVKIGKDPEEDIRRVSAVRESIGEDVSLRVDVNQGYSLGEALKTLRRMEEYNLQLIEQPVPKDDIQSLKILSESLSTPIMADESAYSLANVVKLIRAGAVDIVNIKIMKPGGLYRSRQMAAICEAAGIPNIIGSMLETGIGTAAGVHIAAATRNVALECEFVGPLFLEDDLLVEPLDMGNGRVSVLDRPGLGVDLDEDALHRYKVEAIRVGF